MNPDIQLLAMLIVLLLSSFFLGLVVGDILSKKDN